MGNCCGCFGQEGCWVATKKKVGGLSSMCGLNLLAFVVLVSLYNIVSATVEMCLMLTARSGMAEDDYKTKQHGVTLFLFVSSTITFASGVLGVLSTACRVATFALMVLYVWFFTVAMDVAEFLAILLTASRDKWHLFTTGFHLLFTLIGVAGIYSYYRVLQKGGTGAEGRSADSLHRSFAREAKKTDAVSTYTTSTRSSAAFEGGIDDGSLPDPYANTPLVA